MALLDSYSDIEKLKEKEMQHFIERKTAKRKAHEIRHAIERQNKINRRI